MPVISMNVNNVNFLGLGELSSKSSSEPYLTDTCETKSRFQ